MNWKTVSLHLIVQRSYFIISDSDAFMLPLR
jgi:hypothetical protein